MDIVKQLKLQLDDATESDPDVDNVKCIISPIYEDYFNAIEDEQLEDVDMVRFSADPVYSKTQFACLSNDLDYDEKHYENIKQIDEFISDKSIIRLIIACVEELVRTMFGLMELMNGYMLLSSQKDN